MGAGGQKSLAAVAALVLRNPAEFDRYGAAQARRFPTRLRACAPILASAMPSFLVVDSSTKPL